MFFKKFFLESFRQMKKVKQNKTKLSQTCFRIVPKLSQNCTKIVPNLVQSCPKIGSNLSTNWNKNTLNKIKHFLRSFGSRIRDLKNEIVKVLSKSSQNTSKNIKIQINRACGDLEQRRTSKNMIFFFVFGPCVRLVNWIWIFKITYL